MGLILVLSEPELSTNPICVELCCSRDSYGLRLSICRRVNLKTKIVIFTCHMLVLHTPGFTPFELMLWV